MDSGNLDLTFNIAQLLKEPVGSTRKLELRTALLALDDTAVTDPEGLLGARDLGGKVKVTKLKDGVLVQGDAAANVLLECSRCLTPFLLPVEADLEEQFQQTIDVETGAPLNRAGIEQDDQAFCIDANHMMDLSEPVRQALLVALPMKPLCREDCAGICPVCGANRNEIACGHADESEDDRWSALRSLDVADFPAGDNRTN